MLLFKRRYGSSPLHLLASLVAIALIFVSLSFLWDLTGNKWNLALWLVGGAVLHDFVFLPIYAVLDLIARFGIRDRAQRPVRAINHIRFPAVISGMAFLVYFPLIIGYGRENYIRAFGHAPPDYAGRWALLTLALVVVSAVAYAVRLRAAAQRSGSAPQPAA